MEKKLYVGNLSYSIDDTTLRDHFSQAGTIVEAVVIIDRDSGRSKGFGFVEFSDAEEAKKAIEMFDEQDLDGRNLRVSEARPKKPRESGGYSPRGDDYRKRDSKKRERDLY